MTTEKFRWHVKGTVSFRTTVDVDEWIEADSEDAAIEAAIDRAEMRRDFDDDDTDDDLSATIEPGQRDAFDKADVWRWYFGSELAGMLGKLDDRLVVGTGSVLAVVTEEEHAALFGPVKARSGGSVSADRLGSLFASISNAAVPDSIVSVVVNDFLPRLLAKLKHDTVKLGFDRTAPFVSFWRDGVPVLTCCGFRPDVTPDTIKGCMWLTDALAASEGTP